MVQHVDLLVVTALESERNAVLSLKPKGRSQWTETLSSIQGYVLYHANDFLDSAGQPFSILVCSLSRMGPTQAASDISHFLQEYQPRLVCMSGICAGREGKVELGDVVVLERAFQYDVGKLQEGEFQPVHLTYQPANNLLQWLKDFVEHNQEWASAIQTTRPPSFAAQREWVLAQLHDRLDDPAPWPDTTEDWKLIHTHCPHWKTVVAGLQKEGILSKRNSAPKPTNAGKAKIRQEVAKTSVTPLATIPKATMGVVASGNNVIADVALFPDLAQRDRNVLAVEMEAAALLQSIDSVRNAPPAFVVKGVCDFADPRKNDAFHPYAAEASARFMLAFARVALPRLRQLAPVPDVLSRQKNDSSPENAVDAAVPLQGTLTLTVSPERWQIEMPGYDTWETQDPTANGTELRKQVFLLRQLDHRPLPTNERGELQGDAIAAVAQIQKLAQDVGQALTEALFSSEARELLASHLRGRLAGGGRYLLTIRVVPTSNNEDHLLLADRVLALPWELLWLNQCFPVQEGLMDVVREAVVPELPGLSAPTAELTVVAAVAAPIETTEASNLEYEEECYRIWQALGEEEHRLLLTDRGTVDDFVDAIAEHNPAVAHFTGHGSPGSLLFEDDAARSHEVRVTDLVTKIRNKADQGLPHLFYMASCYGASLSRSSSFLGAHRADRLADPAAYEEFPSSAASLHRAGFHQVVAYFGKVGDQQSTRAEAHFYKALAEGKTARDAVHDARTVSAQPLHNGQRCTHVYPLGWAQLVLYHRGQDVPTAVSQGQSVQASSILEQQRRRRIERLDRAGGERGVEWLRFGFVGRRSPRAELIRAWRDGKRLKVVTGLGGLGKTTLCTEVLPLLARIQSSQRTPVPILALDAQAAKEADEPIQVLWNELEAFEPSIPGWDKDTWGKVLGQVQQDGLTGQALAQVILVAHQLCNGLLVYLDDTESLLAEPQKGQLGIWRNPELKTFWQILSAGVEERGTLGLLASSRIAWEGLTQILPLPAMRKVDMVRLLRWQPTLGQLSSEERDWLATQLDGHPRTVEYLEELAKRKAEEVAQAQDGLGATTYKGKDWRGEVIEPILPDVQEKVDADLLLHKLWDALTPEEQEHLGRCTVVENPVPWRAIIALGTAQTTAPLARAGLLSPAPAGPVQETWWAPHRLVRETITPLWQGDPVQAHLTLAQLFDQEIKDEESRDVWKYLRTIDHYLQAGRPDDAFPHTQTYIHHLRGQGRFQEALHWVDKVLQAQPIGNTQGMIALYQVQLERHLGKVTEESIQRLRDAMEQVDTQFRGNLLHEMGKLYQALGKLQEAHNVLEQALQAKMERHGGEENADVVSTLYALSGVLYTQGNLVVARDQLERYLNIQRQLYQTDLHPDIAATLNQLAGVLQAQGDLELAEETCEYLLSIWESVYKTKEHFNIAITESCFAWLLHQQNKSPQRVKALASHALQVFVKALGPQHPNTITTLNMMLEMGLMDEVQAVLAPLGMSIKKTSSKG